MAKTKIPVTMTLSPETIARLGAMSKELNLSKSACVDQLVSFACADNLNDSLLLVKSMIKSLTQKKKKAT